MLKSHLDAVESSLLSMSEIASNAGHTVHRGTPREVFVKGFLSSHLGNRVGIGTGEVIAASSRPRQKRNQIDIVLYNQTYPKLDLGGGVTCFLAESVVATIEVKSILDAGKLQKAAKAASAVKRLDRSVQIVASAGYVPPGILSLVVAYEGPASMGTVHGWLESAHNELGIVYPDMAPEIAARRGLSSPSLDAVFVLGKGFACFDNMPLGIVSDRERSENPHMKWYFKDCSSGSLLILFTILTLASSGWAVPWLEKSPYIAGSGFLKDGVQFAG